MSVRGRVMGLRLLVVLVLSGLIGRLVWVQVVKAEEITRRGEEMRLARLDLTPVRGTILDRRGMPLAVSVPRNSVVANTFQIPDPAATAAALAKLIAMAPAEVEQTLRKNPRSGWVPLKKGLTQEQAEQILQARIPGISTVPEAQRVYPQGVTANQLVGYVDAQGTSGQYGLEKRYEAELRGRPGYVRAEITLNNMPIEDTIKELVPSEPGQDLILTLDVALQQLVEARLAEVVKEQDARRALAIVMDVHTGEILVDAMSPGANPGDRKTWLNAKGEIDWGRVSNWSVEEHLSPGSIFKAITSSIALEEGVIDLKTTFEDPGFLVRSGRTIKNWDQVVTPDPKPMTLADLLAVSSNVGLIQVGERIPRDTFVRYLKGFGFMEPTGIDLASEGTSYGLSGFEQKTDVDWDNMYIGQHLEVTPIQMVAAVAAIANGGYLVQPHLVREIREPDGKVVRATPTDRKRQVISAATANEVRDLMIHVVKNGTAKAAQPVPYAAGGKTGTAQKFDAKGQLMDRNTADFIGFAPADNPRVVMMILIDEPKGLGYGGVIAAPEFGRLMPQVLQALTIAPPENADQSTPTAPSKPKSAVMPNVQWLPAVWARERMALAGIPFKSVGSGPLAVSQSAKPGARVAAGTTVEIVFSKPDPKLGDIVNVPDFTGLSIAEASQLANEISLTIKPSGTGFVASQQPAPGAATAALSTLDLVLAPQPRKP